MASGLVDPMLQKRAGINLALLQSWEDIVGPAIGATSRPLRIIWPRRLHEDDPFSPATLIIACEGFAALQVQHETGKLSVVLMAFSASPQSGAFASNRSHQSFQPSVG